VIRFKCIYCGQRILASEDTVSKKGKCPKCSHLLVVPWTTKGRPTISPDKEPIPDRPKPRVPEWDKEPRLGPDEQEDVLIAFYKESFGFLCPHLRRAVAVPYDGDTYPPVDYEQQNARRGARTHKTSG